MLYFFWMGALKASMTSLASSKGNSRIVSLLTVLSILIIAAQYCLNVPANMSFTYSQSVIFAAGALDQLFLLPKEEKFVDGGWTYFVHAASYLPLYLFYAIEMTSCSTTLASFGGDHSLYDGYIALLPFMLYYGLPRYIDQSQANEKMTKKNQ